MSKILKSDSNLARRIELAEIALNDLNLEVCTHNELHIVDLKTGKEFHFGKDNSSSFPRFTDSHIYLKE